MTLSPLHAHWYYVWIPIFTAFVWVGTLLAMLITWLAQGRPRYPTMDGSIAYISDIGADILKPLFITGCCITGVGFVLTLVVERWLRHRGRLPPDMRRREKVFSILAILSSVVAAVALILLSIFDTDRHPTAHRLFLLIFMVGIWFTAIFSVVEYRWLSKDYAHAGRIRLAYKIKGTMAVLLILLSIAFGVALFKATNVGAVLEWIIAFGFAFYLISYYWDLRLSKPGKLATYEKASNGQLPSNGAPPPQAV
ncbi:Frag1/DRAM/Sfk1 [Thelephora terrestris]|uniref:Frag1/DRAM/Sfk1 n=1 Tax=Thelephora terrestris TaxID=56493 RepID=A0A9P6LB91_9AGAM|nr:Frag1/DRAM/Sfk1 [Thelephora terrestris]